MALKHHLPNALTLCNLLCGCLAITMCVSSFFSSLEYVPLLVLAAAGFDVLDGLAARLLKVTSDIGIELDSLADMVSFGLVPAVFIYHFIEIFYKFTDIFEVYEPAEGGKLFTTYITLIHLFSPFILVLASAVRLAKFNVAKAGSNTMFSGLPTPAMALSLIGIPFLLDVTNGTLYSLILIWALPVLYMIIAYLMLSKVPFISLKLKGFGVATHWPHVLLVVATAVWVVWLGWGAGLPFLGTYLVCSLLAAQVDKQTEKRAVQG